MNEEKNTTKIIVERDKNETSKMNNTNTESDCPFGCKINMKRNITDAFS